MPGVPVVVGDDHLEASRRQQLLAMPTVRRGVERGPSPRRPWRVAIVIGEVTRRLRELIDALDRRVPRAAHAREPAIAQDAAALREQAVDRLARIREGADDRQQGGG
jgi:hypothetical protein